MKEARRGRLATPTDLFQLTLGEPGRLEAERKRYARSASRALISAALMLAVRGTILPFLILKVPTGILGNVDPSTIELNSYLAGGAITATCVWALSNPLLASVVSLIVYLAASAPDLIHGNGVLGKGLISKAVMLTILGRAVVCGVIHRTLPGAEP